MGRQEKVNKAKQKIIDNYEKQKEDFGQRGYKESSEVFSAAKANAMVFVTSFPIALALILIWVLADRGPIWTADLNFILVLAIHSRSASRRRLVPGNKRKVEKYLYRHDVVEPYALLSL